MKNKPKLRKRSDWKAAYLLIGPAVILILGIAIYPVLQSFYFSLFDLQLNAPSKSTTNLHYKIDLGRYLDNEPFLASALKQDLDKASGPSKQKLSSIVNSLKKMDSDVQKDTGNHYKKVNQILNNFKQPSDKVSIVPVSGKTAKEFQNTIKKIQNNLKNLKNQNVLSNPKKEIGLASGLDGTIIQPNFIGFKHYTQYLHDGRMWAAIWNTVIFTVISVFVEFVLGLGIALLINKAFVGRGLIRATVLIPWALPTAVSAKMWSYLYDGQSGIIAKFFQDIGLVHNMGDLLTSRTGAMFSVILADVWKTTPYMALLLLAGLQVIPKSLYEASAIDGAGKWKQFITITLPLLKSSILVALLFRTLDAFRVFDLIYVLTGGGPANSTETISIYAYKVMFSETNFGGGSTLAVMVFICVALISMGFVKLLGSDLLADGAKK